MVDFLNLIERGNDAPLLKWSSRCRMHCVCQSRHYSHLKNKTLPQYYVGYIRE